MTSPRPDYPTDWMTALDPHTSECSLSRESFAPFLQGRLVLEMGAGGDATVPHALTWDQKQPYTVVGGVPQVLRGDCADLSVFCDSVADGIVSCHLLEDWTYADLIPIILEWRRVLKVGGVIATNCPDQQKFLAHCKASGQLGNDAHKESDFSLQTFRDNVLAHTGPWKEIFVKEDVPPYSWYLIVERI